MSAIYKKHEFLEKYDEVSAYVHKNNAPVYVSDDNGIGDIVVLSAETYQQLTSQFTLNQLLSSAALGDAPGEKHPEVDVFAELAKLK